MNKQSIVVLCGGPSSEHEISLLSARQVVAHLDPSQYVIHVVMIDRHDAWFLIDPLEAHWSAQRQSPLCFLPGAADPIVMQHTQQPLTVDCVIPMVHGRLLEDGCLQGLLTLLRLPFVGCDVLGSALCMHKHIARQLLGAAKLPQPRWMSSDRATASTLSYDDVAAQLGPDFFVKPSNQGSSVGVGRVQSAADFSAALAEALRWDHHVLFETTVHGRELECSVLGNVSLEVTPAGEFETVHDTYSYDAKYNDPEGLTLITPANIRSACQQQLMDLAGRAYRVLQCQGMARVDFFVQDDETILINEVNTLPGFTPLSLYPKNWDSAGRPLSVLLDQLIALAGERHQRDDALSTSWQPSLATMGDGIGS